jgi:hypothetical protein
MALLGRYYDKKLDFIILSFISFPLTYTNFPPKKPLDSNLLQEWAIQYCHIGQFVLLRYDKCSP